MQSPAFKYLRPLLPLLFLFCAAASAQTDAQRTYKVLGITVDGNATTDPSTIILKSGLLVGKEIVVPGDQTQKAIAQLWSLNVFSNISIAIDRELPDGVFLKIVVEEYSRLERMAITGNEEFDEENIRGKVNLIKGQFLRPQNFDVARRRIISAYEEKGYLLAKVDFSIVPDTIGNNRAVLNVAIDEGPEVQVKSITFAGNERFTDGDLRGAMDETSEKTWWKFWSSAKFDRKKFLADSVSILNLYRENGYLDAEIVSDSIWYGESKEDMYIHMTVQEGKPSYVRNIIWKGNATYPDSVLNARLDIKPGSVFNAVRFDENLRQNKDQTDVASLYLDNGYLRFYAQDERLRVAPDSVDIVITINESNKYRIGHVTIKGNNKTQDKVIRRVLYTWPADYFSRGLIIRSIRELATINYFNPETIRPEPQMVNDSTVDLQYNVEERSSDTFNASVGYSGTFGATGAFGLTFNNFNISEPFAGGAGQVLNFEWQFGEASRFRVFSLSFTEPWFMDTPTSVGFSLYDQRQQYYFDLRNTGASLNLGRRLNWPDDFVRADWFLRFQRLSVVDGGTFYKSGDYSQVSLTQVLSRNSLDSPVFPSQGSRITLTTEISGGPLPGSVDYHKHELGFDWFTPLLRIGDQNRLTLYTGAEYGFIKGFNSDSYIPPIEYYYMGGNGLQVQTKPLRGYEDRAIGPRENDQVVNGTIYSRYVAELRFALTLNPMPVYVLAFAEAGNVWKSNRFLDPFDLKRSAGLGARLLIQGVGLIGFDYGYGFDDVEPRDGVADGWHFHFQFGRGF
ncbi:MAG: outer membrane protein assembly factor BamA [Ignavibacteria bacterium]|nr:outer membrane protein assembly factor BamA [Ignavibacteria bacterium]